MEKWERREQKKKKRMPLHGRDTGKVYRDATIRREHGHQDQQVKLDSGVYQDGD